LSGRLETISTFGKRLAALSRSGLSVRGNFIIVPFSVHLLSQNLNLPSHRQEDSTPNGHPDLATL
jgi:hypothetical protein